ncbi:MAG: alpha-E domain-containing protein [Frankiales bacterium]|nr:alpha-E domain-containing protein [Frankiales bacterium]
MLSRVAESLYWIGRYVERAEDTSRLLDVHVQTLTEDPWADEPTACADLLRVMGVEVPEGQLDLRRSLGLLAFDRTATSSIVGALGGARENARGVREALSSELWECLNATYHALPAQESAAGRHGAHGFFRYVRERAAVVSGLLEGTMPRDDCWRFLVLGRSLERVDMTSRLLWARAGQHDVSAGWIGLLKSCSAHEAYLRTYRAAVEPERVVEFLVLDRLFPRSVYAALVQAETCLSELDPTAGRTGVDDQARRLLGRARTDLEFRMADDLLVDLPQLLDSLQRTCSQVGDAVSRRYFHRGGALAWSVEGGL